MLHAKDAEKPKEWKEDGFSWVRPGVTQSTRAVDLACNSPAIPGWASFLSRRYPSSQFVGLLCDMDVRGLGTKLRTLNSISLRHEPDFSIAAVQRWKGNEDMRNSWMGTGHLAQRASPSWSSLQHTSPRCLCILQPCLPV